MTKSCYWIPRAWTLYNVPYASFSRNMNGNVSNSFYESYKISWLKEYFIEGKVILVYLQNLITSKMSHFLVCNRVSLFLSWAIYMIYSAFVEHKCKFKDT